MPFDISIPDYSALTCDASEADVAWHLESPQPQVYVVTVRCQQNIGRELMITLCWEQPLIDVKSLWSPAGHHASIPPFWGHHLTTSASSNAPVFVYLGNQDENRLSVALSEVMEVVRIDTGVHEESAAIRTRVLAPVNPDKGLKVRIDLRAVSYSSALQDAVLWWDNLPGLKPVVAPASAREPWYSTWYGFHQAVDPRAIEQECRDARSLGYTGVIVDDGWQTWNTERGYAYCGDWIVEPRKIPDMEAHVARIHAMGMKYLLWYALPFVGRHSVAWARMQNYLLRYDDRLGAGVLDPRHAVVREHLASVLEQGVRRYGLDGVKLDFIDVFQRGSDPVDRGQGPEAESVDRAVSRLLDDIRDRLAAVRSDILIEYRQSYIGPVMRRTATMLRAGDCPADYVANRMRTLNLRLTSGRTPVHSDMIMWNFQDSTESAALQFINVLFAVPQISVRLHHLPAEHWEWLRFWSRFWNENRGVLLDGCLSPESPDLNFPSVRADDGKTRVLALYDAKRVADLGSAIPDCVHIVNGTLTQGLWIRVQEPWEGSMRTWSPTGQLVGQINIRWDSGIHHVNIPPAGLTTLDVNA